MAKLSVIARQAKREKLVSTYAAKRKALKEAGDYLALDKLPRNASGKFLKRQLRSELIPAD